MAMPAIGEVHIWTARRTPQGADFAAFQDVLSPSEKAAANRFVQERHRLSYVFSHGVLRNILSSYVERAPGEIRFEHNSFGKPRLADLEPGNATQFNMSHSGDVVVVAVTTGRHIGVDVELMRPISEFASIARGHFTAQECAFIHSSPAGIQQTAFFTCWTRKEAVIKAVGKGLSIPLNTFDAYIALGQEGRSLRLPAEAPAVEAWWLTDLTVPPGYVGAVAVEQGIERLVYMAWNAG